MTWPIGKKLPNESARCWANKPGTFFQCDFAMIPGGVGLCKRCLDRLRDPGSLDESPQVPAPLVSL